MDLVRDLLDKQILDRHGRHLGRVDGIVLELREGGPPRVAALEVGPSVLLRRVSDALGDFVALLERRLGVRDGEPVHLPASKIEQAGIDVRLDLAAADTTVDAWEHWVCTHVIGRLPGSGS